MTLNTLLIKPAFVSHLNVYAAFDKTRSPCRSGENSLLIF